MLIAIIGDFGSGKTLFLVLVGVSSNREIWSNFRLHLENYYQLDVMDLIDLGENKDILLDEAYTWLESRVSGSFLNRYISYILFQSRKRTIDIYTTEQLFHTIDRRFRDLVHRVVKCERVNNQNPNKDKWDFRFDIYDTYNEDIKSFILEYDKAKQYFPLYDTKQIIEPFNIESLEFQLRKERPEEQYSKIKEISLKLKDSINGRKLTHSLLKIIMLKNGYKLDYESLVYAYLKNLED